MNIATTEDSDDENDEDFKVKLKLPQDPTSCGSDISPDVGNTITELTVTILDDDSKCLLQIKLQGPLK